VKRRVVLSPLSLLALRVYLHSRYTPCVNPSHSRINALSYQLDFVNYALRKLYDEGALRLLLADDVGLGKTIMTGLLIKELMLRGLAKRVLIVTPRFLTFQWRRELAEKFDIHCIEKDPRADCVVVSVDYLKRHIKQYLEEGWDLAVFDEAHNLTVGARGPTQRYSAAEAVASKARNVLLLSATPHHGKRHDFVARLRLLDPSVDESTLRAAVKRLVVRRLREDVKEEAGIPERYVSPPVVVEPTEEERRLYAEVIRYVKYYYDVAKQARGRRRRALGLVAVVFQKRASSSIAAIKKTVEKRIQALQQMKAGLLKPRDDVKTETEALRHVVADINAIDKELEQLHRLKQLAEAVKIDSKYQKLLELLERHKDSKVIIFTQYRDTMYYLAERLAASREVVTLHGGMTEEERKAAEDKFRRTGKILVATDAASEGLNLQVANVLINYDLPWNPSRLDQRIGRIHRYGQTKPVFVYNMLVADTIDGRIYQILLQKIEEIKKTLGKVFDYLGNAATEKEFLKIVEAALAGRSPEEEVDKLLRQRAVALKDLEELLTSDRIKIEADPRCTDVVTDDELKTLILNTLAALDPRSYEERDGCIKVKYLPRELGKFCRGRCLTEAAGFGGQCPERITVEHPLAKAVLEYHISQLPTAVEVEVEKPCFADGTLWILKGEAKLALPTPAGEREYSLAKVVAYFKPGNTPCGAEGEVPLSILNIAMEVNKTNQAHPPPSDVLEEIREELEKKARRICQKLLDAIYTETSRKLQELEKKRGLSPTEREELKRRIVAEQSFWTQQIDRACQPHIAVAPVLTAFYRPLGYLALGVEWAANIINQGKEGEEIVIRQEEAERCRVIDLRDKPLAGIDLISICPDEVRLIEVKTVTSLNSQIHIQPIEWETMCAKRLEQLRKIPDRRVIDAVALARTLKHHTYLYVVDLHHGLLRKYKNPCDALAPHIQQYMKTQTKYVIPYMDFIKLITPTTEVKLKP
jgi:superfamily II DNA or RNA helicase